MGIFMIYCPACGDHAMHNQWLASSQMECPRCHVEGTMLRYTKKYECNIYIDDVFIRRYRLVIA